MRMNSNNIDPNTGKPFKTAREQQLWIELDHFMKTGEHSSKVRKKARAMVARSYIQR
jgi:hypothetical protein